MTNEQAQQQQFYADDLLRRGLITQVVWETLNYCDIRIHLIESSDPYIFSLQIACHNRSDHPVHCSFSIYPIGHREIADLNIVDQSSGEVIMPKSHQKSLGSGSLPPTSAPVIEPGDFLTRELRGRLDDKDRLRLADISYQLRRGHIYTLQFRYYWVFVSNIITWSVPEV